MVKRYPKVKIIDTEICPNCKSDNVRRGGISNELLERLCQECHLFWYIPKAYRITHKRNTAPGTGPKRGMYVKKEPLAVGVTYTNRHKATTKRVIVAIGYEHVPLQWLGAGDRPREMGVVFEQDGKRDIVYVSTFNDWRK
jgi:hypothetical protein